MRSHFHHAVALTFDSSIRLSDRQVNDLIVGCLSRKAEGNSVLEIDRSSIRVIEITTAYLKGSP